MNRKSKFVKRVKRYTELSEVNTGFMTCILINKLEVTSYESIPLRVAFIARVTSYYLLHKLGVLFT